jgi:5-methylcytosine-specific restriction endonuclease McrA
MSAKKFRGWCINGCGKPIKSGATKYCSFACQHDFRRRSIERAIETGRYITLQISPFLRRYLVARLGERCAKCGWSERHSVTHRVPIEVEHIDGNWQNYRLDNLTLLCPNCHALTPTFRGLNRGRGRAHRLGGRKNPINRYNLPKTAAEKMPTQKVSEEPLMQLNLLPPT